MTFIQPVPEDQAKGDTAAIYARNRDAAGNIPNLVKAFSHRPDVMDGFDHLLGCIKTHMDMRRYELVTLAAAKELTSSYCMLAHGSVMLQEVCDADQLKEIVNDPAGSLLDDTDKAVMQFATKVVRDATSVTKEDVTTLRQYGLSEADIFDVTAAAAIRCFFSKTLDALGVLPDAQYASFDPELRRVLVVGRPISD